MKTSPHSTPLALAFAAATLAAAALAAEARGEEACRGSAYSSLGSDELTMRLSAEGSSGYAGFGLEAKGDELGFEGALRLLSPGAGKGRLVAGPGSPSGTLRLLVDPTSPSALSRGDPVEIDTSLQSRSSVLELGAGPLSLFALAKGRGLSRLPEAAAAGLECALDFPTGGLALVAAASRDGSATASSGWRPDPATAPASAVLDTAEPCYGAAFAADSLGGGGATLFALAASYGRLAGPALAFRLESRRAVGLCDLRFAAASASPNFRELAGPRLGRLLELSLQARLAMRRASSLEASLETQAKGDSLLRAPPWGRKGALRLTMPLAPGRFLDTRLRGELLPEGESSEDWSLALVSKAEDEAASSSARLGATLRWDSAFSGLDLQLETALGAAVGLPLLGLELSLKLLEGGRVSSPVMAAGAASFEAPFGKGASLELSLSLPEKGLVLAPAIWWGPAVGGAPAIEGTPMDALVLCVRYRSSFPISRPSAATSVRSRPRSRRWGLPKAASIAPRAAS